METHPNTQPAATAVPLDRRKHRRYRFSAPVTIRSADGTTMPGMSIEISERGMSLMTGATLNVGDTVELDPVAGAKAKAVVRRNLGRLHGFEFLDLTPEQVQRINESCKTLALYFPNTLDI
jgi:hypothetical protein